MIIWAYVIKMLNRIEMSGEWRQTSGRSKEGEYEWEQKHKNMKILNKSNHSRASTVILNTDWFKFKPHVLSIHTYWNLFFSFNLFSNAKKKIQYKPVGGVKNTKKRKQFNGYFDATLSYRKCRKKMRLEMCVKQMLALQFSMANSIHFHLLLLLLLRLLLCFYFLHFTHCTSFICRQCMEWRCSIERSTYQMFHSMENLQKYSAHISIKFSPQNTLIS